MNLLNIAMTDPMVLKRQQAQALLNLLRRLCPERFLECLNVAVKGRDQAVAQLAHTMLGRYQLLAAMRCCLAEIIARQLRESLRLSDLTDRQDHCCQEVVNLIRLGAGSDLLTPALKARITAGFEYGDTAMAMEAMEEVLDAAGE